MREDSLLNWSKRLNIVMTYWPLLQWPWPEQSLRQRKSTTSWAGWGKVLDGSRDHKEVLVVTVVRQSSLIRSRCNTAYLVSPAYWNWIALTRWSVKKTLLSTRIERGFLGLKFFLLVHCSFYSHISNTSRDWHNSMSVPDQLKITVYSFSKYLWACMCLSVHNAILFEAKVGAIKKGES